jgi:hypothetical protein
VRPATQVPPGHEMRSGQRGSLAVLALAVGLLAGILGAAVQASRAAPGPGGRAAALVPASALAYVHLSTDAGDPAARALARLAPKLPGYARAREAALAAISPPPGAVDLERDVRPWLGDEAALALVDLGGGRFGTLAIAQVRDKARAGALLRRVAGARPPARYGDTMIHRYGPNAAAFVHGFLVAGPELAVQRSIDAARGDTPSLKRSATFERALGGARRPAELYVSARGLREAPAGVPKAIAAVLAGHGLRGLGALAGADGDRLRLRVRAVGATLPGGDAVAQLAGRVPADAIAMLAAPDAAAIVSAAERAGAKAALDAVRTAVADGASLDADRDLLRRLGSFAVWVAPGDAAPVIALAARTSDPKGLREALARLQEPVARVLAADQDALPAFRDREIAGTEAYTLAVAPGFAPTYAVAGRTAVVATAPEAVEAFLGRDSPRLRETPAFRSGIPRMPPRAESLGFFDVRQLLALGERTGLTAEGPRPVHIAGAVIQREEDDTTAELFFEIS